MAVNFSPYSKVKGADAGYSVDANGNTVYTSMLGVKTVYGKGDDTKKQTAIRESAKKLAGKYRAETARIMTDPTLSMEERRAKVANLEQDAKQDGSVAKIIKKGLGVVFNPVIAPIKMANKYAIEPSKQLANATAEFTTDTLNTAVGRQRSYTASPDRALSAWDRFKKHGWEDDKFQLFKSPTSVVNMNPDSKGAKVGQFIVDTAGDPISWVTPAAKAIGKVARLASSATFLTGARSLIPGAQKIALDVARWGDVAIPRAIRKELGIDIGVKWMGMRVPYSDSLSYAYRYTLAPVGKVVADVGAATIGKTAFGHMITRKSLRGAVASGIFRKVSKDTDISPFVTAAAHTVSNSVGRGVEGNMTEGFVKQIMADLGPQMQALRDDPTFGGIVHALEVGDLSTLSPDVRLLAERAKVTWDGQAASVTPLATGLKSRWGVDAQDIGFLENHVYHTLTRDAAKQVWAKNKNNILSVFQDISTRAGRQLEQGQGTGTFRKYVAGEDFMGTKLITGTIDEINGVYAAFLAKKGLPVHKFFEDDLLNISLSYAQSIGRTHGRFANVNSLFEFGPDVIKPLLSRTVHDPDLVARMTTEVSRLSKLSKRAAAAWASAANRSRIVSDIKVARTNAEDILAGGMASVIEADDAVAAMRGELDDIAAKIRDSEEYASSLTPEALGTYQETNQGTSNYVAGFQRSLDDGTQHRFVAAADARAEYFALNPDANPEDGLNSLEWLSEQVVRGLNGGKADANHELVPLGMRRKQIMDEMDALPPGSNPTALHNELQSINEVMAAHVPINAAREAAPYSKSGLVVGYSHDVVPENPYNIWATSLDGMEDGGALMMHAPPEQNLLNFESQEHMTALVGSQTLVDLGEVFARNGMVDPTWGPMVAETYKSGVVDPLYRSMDNFEGQANLLQYMLDAKDAVLKGGDGDGWDVAEFFSGFKKSIDEIAILRDPATADEWAAKVMVEFNQSLVETAKQDGFDGVLMPLKHIFEGDDAGEWAILMHRDVPSPTPGNRLIDSVQRINMDDGTLNPLFASIRNNKTEAQQLDILTGRARLKASGFDPQVVTDARTALEIQLSNIAPPPDVVPANKMITVDGVAMPRDAATPAILARERALVESELKTLRESLMDATTRTRMAMDHRRTLDKWTPEVEQVLVDDIGMYNDLLANAPVSGASKAENARWMAETEQILKQVEGDPVLQRLQILAAADEANLARVAGELGVAQFNLTEAAAGRMGRIVVDETLKGWALIERMGSQMPQELLDVWGYNISKLNDPREAHQFFKNVDLATNYWKRYVTNSVGFVTRNAYSSTFMNYTGGVSNKNIGRGIKWATEQNKRGAIGGGDSWMARMGLTSKEDIAFATTVMERVHATGTGLNWETDGVMGLGKSKYHIGDNPIINATSKANSAAERAARISAAMHSVERGDSFQQTVAFVSRLHIDYSDMSVLDTQIKRVIPFYMWSSRNVPLQVQQIATRPKAYYEYKRVQEEFPIEYDDPSTPQIEGMVLPKYLRENGPMGWGAKKIISPDMPFNRLIAQIEAFSPRGLASNSSPIYKVPFELATGRIAYGDGVEFTKQEARGVEVPIAKLLNALRAHNFVEFEDGKLMMSEQIRHVLQQALPPLMQLQRLTGGYLGGKEELEERWLTSVMSWFGIPIKEIGDVATAKTLKSQGYGIDAIRRKNATDAERRTVEQDRPPGYKTPYND